MISGLQRRETVRALRRLSGFLICLSRVYEQQRSHCMNEPLELLQGLVLLTAHAQQTTRLALGRMKTWRFREGCEPARLAKRGEVETDEHPSSTIGQQQTCLWVISTATC